MGWCPSDDVTSGVFVQPHTGVASSTHLSHSPVQSSPVQSGASSSMFGAPSAGLQLACWLATREQTSGHTQQHCRLQCCVILHVHDHQMSFSLSFSFQVSISFSFPPPPDASSHTRPDIQVSPLPLSYVLPASSLHLTGKRLSPTGCNRPS